MPPGKEKDKKKKKKKDLEAWKIRWITFVFQLWPERDGSWDESDQDEL